MNKKINKRSPQRLMQKSHAGAVKGLIIATLVLVGAVVVWKLPVTKALVEEYFPAGEGKVDDKYILHNVELGSFRITITENGTVDSLRNATLSNSVEGSTTIISLVPEGSRVNAPVVAEFDGVVEFVDVESESQKSIMVRSEGGKEKLYEFPMGEFTEVLVSDRQAIKKGEFIAGDMLCELDSSTLVEKEKQMQIDVTTARADLEKADKSLQIQESTNESILAQAKLAEKLADLDLKKYTAEGGEYEQAVETLTGGIRGFEEQLAMAQENYEQVRDQARRGYTNLNVLEGSRIKVTQQQVLFTNEKNKLNLLEKFTKERNESELEQQAKDTVLETKRAVLEGEAVMAGLKADFTARDLTLQVEEEKLVRLLRQIKACRLIATQQGEAVYASQNSRRSEPVVIEEGATVRERQAIINLPDLDQMKIDARIHESRISRIMLGQPVEISIDAVSGVMYHGILESVSSVPVPGNWPNTDLKEYEASIRITDSKDLVRKLKPGMTAEIRIIVDDREGKVLQIPVQSALSLADQFFTYVVSGSKVEMRNLKVGDANDEYLEVLDGAAEGEQVVMNPRTHFSREINELEAKLVGEKEDNREKTQTPGRPAAPAERSGAGGTPGGGPAGAGSPGAGGPGGGRPDPKTIFERLDKNKDGFITSDESDLQGKFAERDADSDGKISLEELTKAFGGG